MANETKDKVIKSMEARIIEATQKIQYAEIEIKECNEVIKRLNENG